MNSCRVKVLIHLKIRIMAKLKGPLKIEGTLGDISFYKQNGQYYARNKGGVSADRIKKDPRFARTRENLAEFGRANAATKLIRKAFRLGLHKVKDPRLSNRLMPKMMKVLQADTTHVRGERVILDAHLSSLVNFQFSKLIGFDSTFFVEPGVTVDLTAGTAQVSWPSFNPALDMVVQNEATHVRLFSLVALVDFENSKVEGYIQESTEIELSAAVIAAQDQDFTFAANAGLSLLVAVGIEYLQEMNGVYYPLQNGRYNSLEINHIET